MRMLTDVLDECRHENQALRDQVSALTAQVADLSARVETLTSEIHAAIEEMPACRRQHLLGAPLLVIVRETVSHMFWQQSRAEAAEKKLAAAEAEVARLRALSAALAAKLDAVANDPQFQSMAVMAFMHGQSYTGPTWANELAAIKEALPPVPASSQE